MKIKLKLVLITCLFLSSIWSMLLINLRHPSSISISIETLKNVQTQISSWSNASAITGVDLNKWNYDDSNSPAIVVDSAGTLHVVWSDLSTAAWDDDREIMYSSCTPTGTWSDAIVISDKLSGGFWWNTGDSINPAIAVDDAGTLHVVWEDDTNGPWGNDWEILYSRYTSATGWTNATVISDGLYNNSWNTGGSYDPAIAIDGLGTIHVVWEDHTDGVWGNDREIFYANYTDAAGWSNATIISDGLYNYSWNSDGSYDPAITIDNSNNVHVVWQDDTNAPTRWGWDSEIMHAIYTPGIGWSNATVISDGHYGIYWNTGSSLHPAIAADRKGTVHAVWDDDTDSLWGFDNEIFYACYTATGGWSSIQVVSDGVNGMYWNNDDSEYPSIALDKVGRPHVVWQDHTDGQWGSDIDIFYSNLSSSGKWLNATLISDGFQSIYWNNDSSEFPQIAVIPGAIHVVWQDQTDGEWGFDIEIFYNSIKLPINPPYLTPLIQNGTQVLLNWTDVSTASRYYLYRDTKEIIDLSTVKYVNATSLTQFVDEVLKKDTYYYAIVAGNVYTNSSISNLQEINISFPAPGIPGFNFISCLILIAFLGLVIIFFKIPVIKDRVL